MMLYGFAKEFIGSCQGPPGSVQAANSGTPGDSALEATIPSELERCATVLGLPDVDCGMQYGISSVGRSVSQSVGLKAAYMRPAPSNMLSTW